MSQVPKLPSLGKQQALDSPNGLNYNVLFLDALYQIPFDENSPRHRPAKHYDYSLSSGSSERKNFQVPGKMPSKFVKEPLLPNRTSAKTPVDVSMERPPFAVDRPIPVLISTEIGMFFVPVGCRKQPPSASECQEGLREKEFSPARVRGSQEQNSNHLPEIREFPESRRTRFDIDTAQESSGLEGCTPDTGSPTGHPSRRSIQRRSRSSMAPKSKQGDRPCMPQKAKTLNFEISPSFEELLRTSGTGLQSEERGKAERASFRRSSWMVRAAESRRIVQRRKSDCEELNNEFDEAKKGLRRKSRRIQLNDVPDVIPEDDFEQNHREESPRKSIMLRQATLPAVQTTDIKKRIFKKVRRLAHRGTTTRFREQQEAKRSSIELNIQRQRAQEMFTRYDADGSGYLDTAEMKECLAHLGFTPRSKEEKRRFAEIFGRIELSGDEIDFERCFGLVTELMDLCRGTIRAELEEQLLILELETADSVPYSTMLGLLEGMDIMPRTSAEIEVMKDAYYKEACVDREEREIESLSLNIRQVEAFLSNVRGALGSMRRERFHSIVHEVNIDRVSAEMLRGELCELKDRFDDLDTNGVNFLDFLHTKIFFTEYGMRPATDDQRKMLQNMLNNMLNELGSDGKEKIDFLTCIELLQEVRILAREGRRDVLWDVFMSVEKKVPGVMSVPECSQLLSKLSFSPRNRTQQRQIAAIFEASDRDGSGDYDFQEISVLVQLVHEMLQRMHHKNEMEIAAGLGMSREQLQEYHEAFDMFDEEGEGELRVADVRRLLDTLRVNASGDVLNSLVQQVDADKSGFIEFTEFLTLVMLIQQRKSNGNWT